MKNRVHFMHIPHLAGVLVFYILPLLLSFVVSFKKSIYSNEFVLFSNYTELFTNQAFTTALYNTLLFLFISVPALLSLSLASSYIFYIKNIEIKYLPAFLIPYILPSASTAGFFEAIFSNIYETKLAFLIPIILFIWKNFGFFTLILYALFTQLDKEIINAARIDGADEFSIFYKISFRMILKSFRFVIVYSIYSAFKLFKEIFVIYGTHPNRPIYTLQHFINNTFMKFDITRLSTIAASIVLFSIFVGTITMKVLKNE